MIQHETTTNEPTFITTELHQRCRSSEQKEPEHVLTHEGRNQTVSCNAPLAGWKSKDREPTGKRRIVFDKSQAIIDLPVNVRCGRCMGCKIDKAREWALRCQHEAQLHDDNSFVTLTYDDEHVPMRDGNCTLRPSDYVLFMKRLRLVKPGVRFFQCGEYGETNGRPHHHALLFNCHFGDRTVWREGRDYPLYRSEVLEKLWKFGHCEIGEVNFTTAAYVAKYTCKQSARLLPGQFPEYLTMSRRPGIGRAWLDKWLGDVYPNDAVISEGREYRPPRYYENILATTRPRLAAHLKSLRIAENSDKDPLRETPRERILRAKLKERKRQI